MKRPLIVVACLTLLLTIIRLRFFPGNDEEIRELLLPYADAKLPIAGKGIIKEVRSGEYSVRYYVTSIELELSGSVQRSDSGFLISFYKYESINNKLSDGLIPGAEVSFFGVPEYFEKASNDCGYDEFRDMYGKGMVMKIKGEKIEVIAKPVGIKRFLRKVRDNVSVFYSEALDGKSAGVLSAVCLGDKELLSAELRDDYGKAGMSHVLAISGLHISIFGVCIYEFLRRRGVGFAIAAAVAVISVLLYIMMAGVTVSSLRAVIMFVISMGANVLGRKYDGLNASFLAFCLIVLWNPRYMLQIGFMYSFAAVMGIYLVNELIEGKYRRVNPILRMLASSAGVCIMTFPITAYYSYEVPVYTVVLNLIIIPLVTPLLISGVAAGIISYASYDLGSVALIPAKLILKFFNMIASYYDSIPGSVAVIGRPYKMLLLVYYAGIIVIYFGLKKRLQWGIGIILLIALLILPNRIYRDSVTFLDVGQGDGIYIETASGYKIMIDGGSSSKNNVGEGVIQSYLSCHGRGGIDMWFISHYDSDHISGLVELLYARYSIDAIFLAKSEESVKYREITEAAKRNGVKVCEIHEFTEVKIGKDRIFVMPVNGDDANDRGLIVRMDYQTEGIDALFAGDISMEMERSLVNARGVGALFDGVDIFKAIHHGSRNSNSDEMLAKCKPKTIVISCGRNNRYGHPHSEAVERMQRYTDDIRITARCGGVVLRPAYPD
ncbi:MAG: DNA internalization-related competence protein ComEC/Rec2 [Lachnospiraceae bacterium]|nr:DNA internalization-related competence protein ComEC/Rec2 [Lachnospiraceae bacterium]